MIKILKLFFVAALIFPAVYALFAPGFYGASDELHIAWLHQMHEAISAGQIPPRFAPDLSFGFGYPLFHFVYPLPFYLAEIVHVAGFNLVDSIKTVFILSVPFSFGSMYIFMRQYTKKSLAILSSLIYIYAPYRATDIYVRGAIGEIVIFIFIPLAMYFVSKIFALPKGKNWKHVGGLGIAVALIVLSHNIVAYMFIPFLVLFVIINVFLNRNFAVLKHVLIGFLLGMLASMYFWAPALLNKNLLKYDTVFQYWDHFPSLKQLITPYFGYGASVAGNYDTMSFFVGYPVLFLCCFLLLLPIFIKRFNQMQISLLLWSVLVLGISFFLMNYRSTFFWESIPFIQYFQFPWRFLTMVVFSGATLIVMLDKMKIPNIFIYITGVVVVLISFQYFQPQEFLGRKDQYFLDKYIPYPEVKDGYLTHSEEYLRLPQALIYRPEKLYPVFWSDENLEILKVEQKDKYNATAEIFSPSGGRVNFNKYNFPGWNAKINGEVARVSSGAPFGQVQVHVPSGRHFVTISYREPVHRVIINIVSVLSLVFALSIFLGVFKIKKS